MLIGRIRLFYESILGKSSESAKLVNMLIIKPHNLNEKRQIKAHLNVQNSFKMLKLIKQMGNSGELSKSIKIDFGRSVRIDLFLSIYAKLPNLHMLNERIKKNYTATF